MAIAWTRFGNRRIRVRWVIMAVLIFSACILTYYFHRVLRTETVFTHFFYLPIILAALWWKRKGIVVALFLAAFLILSHILLRERVGAVEDYLRAIIFVVLSIIVAWLSERIEKAERASRLLASIVECSDDAVIGETLEGTITSWNGAAERIYGYAAEEVIGRPVAILVPPGLRGEMPRMRATLESGQRVEHYETVRLRKDGTQVQVSLAISPIREADGRISGVSTIARDITSRKRLEREILEISERERQRIGQDLHDELGQLLTGILCLSHSLTQRLAAAGVPEAAQAEEIPALVKQAIEQSRHLAHGLCPAAMEQGSLIPALQELVSRNESLFHVNCSLEWSDDVPIIDLTLATQLYRICQEALTNAARHSGAKTIQVRLAREGDRMVLTVEDDGLGPDAMEQLQEDRGMGLRIMRYRASMVNAAFEISRATAGGTRVCCSVAAGGGQPQAESE